jgi:hypothetical protein
MKYDITQLKDESNEVSRQHYISILKQVASKEMLEDWEKHEFENFKDADYIVFKGDVQTTEMLQCFSFHMLVIGDVLCKWMNCEGPFNGGGSLTIIGDLHSLFFSNEEGKTVHVDGSMTVNRITLNAHEDATLTVLGNLTTKCYIGDEEPARVAGDVAIEYGAGAVFSLDELAPAVHTASHDANATATLLGLDQAEDITITSVMKLLEASVEL